MGRDTRKILEREKDYRRKERLVAHPKKLRITIDLGSLGFLYERKKKKKKRKLSALALIGLYIRFNGVQSRAGAIFDRCSTIVLPPDRSCSPDISIDANYLNVCFRKSIVLFADFNLLFYS